MWCVGNPRRREQQQQQRFLLGHIPACTVALMMPNFQDVVDDSRYSGLLITEIFAQGEFGCVLEARRTPYLQQYGRLLFYPH